MLWKHVNATADKKTRLVKNVTYQALETRVKIWISSALINEAIYNSKWPKIRNS